MKKFLRYGLGSLVTLLVLGAGGFWYWAQSSLAIPAPEALVAMDSDDRVTVEDGDYVVFRPVGVEPATGLILYPGAACDPRGYSAVLRRIAARGYLVVVVKMPLNMAIFGPGRADDVEAKYPAIKHWVLAGHSMGGAMAAHYAHNHADKLSGLIIWDAWPAEMDTLVDLTIPVWHIHRATPDGRAPATFEQRRNLFPATSTWVPLRGGIHMQFGSFIGGGYKEDWKPLITSDDQHDQIVTATLNALLAMGGTPPA
ncbi:MAG: alpha/beta fold hydrolase [Gammaproteobacteria bacterium]